MAEADFALMVAETAADVAISLAEAGGARERATLLEAQRRRLGTSLTSLDVRLAAGATVRLADRLTLQSRIAALELSLEEARRAAADAEAAARTRLSLPPDAPLPHFSAPDPASIRPQDSPAVAAAEARAAEASAMGRMARASAAPMTSVGLRLERERGAAGNQDTIGLAFASDLPFRARDYARAGGRAAEAERAAARADGESARQRVTNALGRAERAERLAETARRLAKETELRLEAEHDALNRTVSVGAASGMAGESAVLHAVDILDRTTETQLRIIEAETAARMSRAELWRHAATPRLLRLAAAFPSSP
jgi:outer membrane protein TolC